MKQIINNIKLIVLFFFNAGIAFSQNDNSNIKNTNKVVITANLKEIGFDEVPLDIIIPDFIDKKSYAYDVKKYDSATGYFKGVFSIAKPTIMMFFLKQVFVSPGDSINVFYKIINSNPSDYKDTLIIAGKNSGNYFYNYFFKNEYINSPKILGRYKFPLAQERFNSYQESLTKYYTNLYDDFDKFCSVNICTKEYENFVNRQIYCYWVDNYLVSIQNSAKPEVNMRNINRADINSKLILNQDSNSYVFLSALLKFHKTITGTSKISYAINEFVTLKKDAELYPIFYKDFLLTNDIIDFSKNKFGHNKALQNELISAIKGIQTGKYQEKLAVIKNELLPFNGKISAELETIKLINLSNQNINFGDVIAENKGKIIYIDFWASWCLPCRKESAPLNKFIAKFSAEKIAVIQISLDTESDAWKAAVKKDKIASKLQYRFPILDDSKKFDLTRDFLAIPHYMIIDRDGKVIQYNAVRPSDYKLADYINILLKQ